MPDFRRIYFDTNILKPAWPDLSARVVNVIDLASSLAVEVAFPYVTIVELEKHWNVAWRTQRSKALSATDALKRSLGLIGLDPMSISQPTVPAVSDMAAEYNKCVECLLDSKK